MPNLYLTIYKKYWLHEMKIFEIITEAPRRNEELIQKVKDLWDSGITSQKEIALKLRITPAQVMSILAKYYRDRPNKQKHEKFSPELIQQVKDLWDSGVTSHKEIARELGLSDRQASTILINYYPDRINKTKKDKISTELIQQVKDLWDSGVTSHKEIAAKLNLSNVQVSNILHDYYSDRKNKQETNLTPELIQQVKDLWDNGITVGKEIEKELGLTKNQVANILKKYYPDRVGKRMLGTVPNELIPSASQMYKNGQSPATIVQMLGLNVDRTTIVDVLKKQPNWNEIRAEHLVNRQARKQKVATTDIHKPGTIGNKRSKGPSSRHTAGVDWPKYG